MNFKSITCILLFFFLLYSCSNSTKEKPVYKLQHNTIDLGDDFIGHGGYLAIYKDTILGMEMGASIPPFYCFLPFELDVSISYLCVSDDDSKLWAISTDPDISLVNFDLGVLSENFNSGG